LKIDGSQCALLEKLKIRPFRYKMHVKRVYDNGALFSTDILDINSEDIVKNFSKTI